MSAGETVRWSSRLRCIVLLLPCLFLTSCATMNERPAGGFDANPPRDAVVGMWTHSGHLGEKFTTSRLFNSDGTGLVRWSGDQDRSHSFTWRYDGRGMWTAYEQDGTIHLRFRITPAPSAGGSRFLFLVGSTAWRSVDTQRRGDAGVESVYSRKFVRMP
jgi:hypothetical protein